MTVEQREERRLEAARLFRRGKLSQAQIARLMGVSPGAVSQWFAAWQSGGDEDLRARPRTGRKARLSARQWEKLGHVLERGPMAAGFDSPRWTLKRIAALIEDCFGVTYHPRYLERPLRARGFALREQEGWSGGHASEARAGGRRAAAGRAGSGGRPSAASRSSGGGARRSGRARPQGATSSQGSGSRAAGSRVRVPPSLLPLPTRQLPARQSPARQVPARRSMH